MYNRSDIDQWGTQDLVSRLWVCLTYERLLCRNFNQLFQCFPIGGLRSYGFFSSISIRKHFTQVFFKKLCWIGLGIWHITFSYRESRHRIAKWLWLQKYVWFWYESSGILVQKRNIKYSTPENRLSLFNNIFNYILVWTRIF